jgi:hypothetical protein
MSESALTTTASPRQPLALPERVATAFARANALLRRPGGAPGEPTPRRREDAVFPGAIGATDLELARLGRRDDPEELLRRAKTETGVRTGLIKFG